MTRFGEVKVVALGFGGSFLLSLLTFRPELAHAGWERLAATACGIEAGMYRSEARGVYNSQPNRGYAFCPVTDTEEHPKENIAGVNIHVTDRHTGNEAIAFACISYWSSAGAECGAASRSGVSFTGAATLTPSLSKWTEANAAHFGFLEVTLPAQQGSNPSTFSGIFSF
jgi:hypothetical protein